MRTRRRQAELKPGQTRKEVEGVFMIVNEGSAVRPRESGHRRRQVFRGTLGSEGRRSGHHGPFNQVRNLKDGDEVKIESKDKDKKKTT